MPRRSVFPVRHEGAYHVTNREPLLPPMLIPDPARNPKVLTVRCPFCGASPSKPCFNTTTSRRYKIPHAMRVNEAQHQGVM